MFQARNMTGHVIVYQCELCIRVRVSILPLSKILVLDLVTVSTVWHLLFSYFFNFFLLTYEVMYLVDIMVLCPHSLCEQVLFDNVLGLTRKLLDQVFTVIAIVTLLTITEYLSQMSLVVFRLQVLQPCPSFFVHDLSPNRTFLLSSFMTYQLIGFFRE